jgi:hypothetical protein
MTTVAMKSYNTQASATVLSETLLSTLERSLEMLRMSSNIREKILEMQALEQFASQIELKLLTLVAENHEC